MLIPCSEGDFHQYGIKPVGEYAGWMLKISKNGDSATSGQPVLQQKMLLIFFLKSDLNFPGQNQWLLTLFISSWNTKETLSSVIVVNTPQVALSYFCLNRNILM